MVKRQKDRQHNGQQKKDLQNTTQKIKDLETQIPL